MVQRVVCVHTALTYTCLVAIAALFASHAVQAQDSNRAQERLIYAQTVFRHGDRAPVAIFPTHEEKWNVVDGQLSDIGVAQHHAFGRYLRESYLNGTIEGLTGEYHPDLVCVRSTDYDRTLGSAVSMLKELYPEQTVPIPVHTLPKQEELLLKYWSTCPSYNAPRKGINEDFSLHIEKDPTFDLTALQKASGFLEGQYPTAEFLLRIWDNVVCMEAHGMDIPEEIASIRKEIDDFVKRFYYQLYIAQPNDERGVGSAALMHQLRANFDAVIENASSSPKLMFYSAHDNTLIGVHDMLGLVSDEESDLLLPGYANSIIFELWRDDSASPPQFNIRVRRGMPLESIDGSSWSYTTEPLEILCLDSKKEVCPLDEWRKRVEAANTFEQGCCMEVDAFREHQCREYVTTPGSTGNPICDVYRTYCPKTACGPSAVYSSVVERCLPLHTNDLSPASETSSSHSSTFLIVTVVVVLAFTLLVLLAWGSRRQTSLQERRSYGSLAPQIARKSRHE